MIVACSKRPSLTDHQTFYLLFFVVFVADVAFELTFCHHIISFGCLPLFYFKNKPILIMTTIHQHYGNDEHHNIEIEAQIWVKYFCFIPIPSVYVDSTCTYVD